MRIETVLVNWLVNLKIKRVMQLIMIFIFCTPIFSAHSSDHKSGVPKSLFGIELGKVYDVGEDLESRGNLPIKIFTGANQFLSPYGFHYYFQPLKDYSAFEYIEKDKKPNEKHYRSSFHLYIYPVIPNNITTLEQHKNTPITDWKVVTIDWFGEEKYGDDADKDYKSNAYYWAMDMCKTFKLDLGAEPEIFNYYEQYRYTCTFTNENREFKVEGHPKKVSLSLNKETRDQIEDSVELFYRKIKAEDIRPY